MPNIAGLLKAEIVRLSNKTVRQHLEPIQNAAARQRWEIAALKKQIQGLERELLKLRRAAAAGNDQSAFAATDAEPKSRFVAKGLRSLRARLGLSAEDFGRLIGVSGQSVYNWEQGRVRPRPAQVAAIAALRGIGKREAMARLAALDTDTDGAAQKDGGQDA